MAKTIEELLQVAETIRTNQTPDSNTADLVGGVIKELLLRLKTDKAADDVTKKNILTAITTLTESLALSRKMEYEYNVSEYHNINGDSIFTLSEAIPLILERHLGMKCSFRMKIKFATLESVVKVMTYQYLGNDVSDANFTEPKNWISITPVILTETQYDALSDKLDNTLYYVIEED